MRDDAIARAVDLTARALRGRRDASACVAERDEAIRQAVAQGVGMRELARASGLTAARISQICSR